MNAWELAAPGAALPSELRQIDWPQAPAGMEPNYCNAEQCTCRMGIGYVACDQQPKWKPARGVIASDGGQRDN